MEMLKGLVGWLGVLSFVAIGIGALWLSVWNVKDDLCDVLRKKK